jgi:hypothetical protein
MTYFGVLSQRFPGRIDEKHEKLNTVVHLVENRNQKLPNTEEEEEEPCATFRTNPVELSEISEWVRQKLCHVGQSEHLH